MFNFLSILIVYLLLLVLVLFIRVLEELILGMYIYFRIVINFLIYME